MKLFCSNISRYIVLVLSAILLFSGIFSAHNAYASTPTLSWEAPRLLLVRPNAIDFDRDGVLELFASEGGKFTLVDCKNGKSLRTFGVLMYPATAADMDGDTYMEIASSIENVFSLTKEPQKLQLIKKTFMGYDHLLDLPLSHVRTYVLKDLDNDGVVDLMGTTNENYLMRLDPLTGKIAWKQMIERNSIPAVGDLDGDTVMEVIALRKVTLESGKTGEYKAELHVGQEELWFDVFLTAFDGRDGEILWSIKNPGLSEPPPLIADLDGDGNSEVIYASDRGMYVMDYSGMVNWSIESESGIEAIAAADQDGDGTLEIYTSSLGWVRSYDFSGSELWSVEFSGLSGQMAIADVSGNGYLELLVPSSTDGLVALNAQDGSIVWQYNEPFAGDESPGSPIVGDLDGDGELEIAFGTQSRTICLNTDSKGKIAWPKYLGGANNSNNVVDALTYAAYLQDPSVLKVFPKWPFIIGGVLLVFVAIGLFIGRQARSTLKEVKAVPEAVSESLASLEKKFAKDPNNTILLKNLAFAYAKENVRDLRVVDVYKGALKLTKDPRIIKGLAMSYIARGIQNPEAEAVYVKALEQYSDDEEVLSGIVDLFANRKEIKEVFLKAAEKFYYLGKDNFKATNLIAPHFAEKQKSGPFPIFMYKKYLASDPDDNLVLSSLLMAYKEANMGEEYLSVVREALPRGKIGNELKRTMAINLASWEYDKDAEPMLEEIITQKPEDVDALKALKDIYIRQENRDMVHDLTERLIHLYTDLQRANPTSAEIKLELGKLYNERGEYKAALGQLKTIHKSHSQWKSAISMLVDAYSGVGEHDKAAESLSLALGGKKNLKSDNAGEFLKLAEQYAKAKSFDLAVDTLESLITHGFNFDGEVEKRKDELSRMSEIHAASQVDQNKTVITSGDKTFVGEPQQQRRYSLIEEIGRGGMGIVFRAEDTILGRSVAYKVLPEDLKNHPRIIKSFFQESRALATLNHQNIVTVFDAGQQDGEYFFCMEYVEGETVKERMVRQGGKLNIAESIEILRQTTDALNYAHQNKIIHRDIKSSNIMISKAGVIKLMDFGLAKILEEAAGQRTAVSGTPFYMSPEQVIGEGVDHRSDLYSLGVTAYEMVVGQVPFKTGDLGYHHLHTAPKPPIELNPDIPQSFNDILLKCMAKKKEDRFQTASELLDAIESVKV